MLEFFVHIGLDALQRHVARAFDHHLHVVLPGLGGQLAQRAQFAELGIVVGVGDAARTQAVAEAERHVVGLHDLADLVEVRVQEVFLVVRQAPLGHDRTAARDDAGDTVGGQRHVAQQHAGVDGEVVHALLGLLDQRVAEHLPGQVLGDAAGLVQRLVDRHRADRDRRVAQDPFAGFVDVLAGGQVHDGVGAPADRPHHLFHFLGQRRGHRRVAQVAVDLDAEIATDRHRLQLGVVDVGGNDGAARGDFLAHEFRRDVFRTQRQAGAQRIAGMLAQQRLVVGLVVQRLQVQRFAQRHVLHFRRDDALARIVHLRHVGAGLGAARVGQLGKAQVRGGGVIGTVAAVFRRQARQHFSVAALFDPLGAHGGQAGLQVDMHVRIAVRARGVVHRDRRILHLALVGARGSLQDRAQRHADIGAAARQVGLAGSRVGKFLVEVAFERFE
ncbi:hypothetical protein D3C72_1081580 [compost metagenome]